MFYMCIVIIIITSLARHFLPLQENRAELLGRFAPSRLHSQLLHSFTLCSRKKKKFLSSVGFNPNNITFQRFVIKVCKILLRWPFWIISMETNSQKRQKDDFSLVVFSMGGLGPDISSLLSVVCLHNFQPIWNCIYQISPNI